MMRHVGNPNLSNESMTIEVGYEGMLAGSHILVLFSTTMLMIILLHTERMTLR